MDKKNLLKSTEKRLKEIYKENFYENMLSQMEEMISTWEKKEWKKAQRISEKNIYLITYGDSIYEKGVPTMDSLEKFLLNNMEDTVTDVHILPMFEYTSDDGFSVVDYRKIDPNLGEWENINRFSQKYRLMYDFVANHMSKSSEWFKGYLNGEEKYRNYFIPFDPNFDSEIVVRPRTSPLFHSYQGKNGKKTAWTTFSEDQVDLNFQHFPLFIEMTEILIEYAFNGATSIRLDAIGFMWKISGTNCMHLKETHEIIKIWREILDYLKPNTQIITETNVPHLENISYFGNGNDEANMVYQFTLPPLVLHTLTTHNSEKINNWAKTIDRVGENATYFNFLASHDGIGMRPTEGILSVEERQVIVDKVVENGGKVSYKNNPDGSKSVYELNINYFDALINRNEDLELETKVNKFMAANGILLSMVGVPALYYHSLLGSTNDYVGLEESGINRRINREKFSLEKIETELQSDLRRKNIFNGLKDIISIRKSEKAFSPYGYQNVLDFGKDVFALERTFEDAKITFLVNITCNEKKIDSNLTGKNLLTGKPIERETTLKPYEFMWIK
ncbi:MAG: alpha-amylase family glycosyl hydrolase [Fusobacteriaceae bacterium]